MPPDEHEVADMQTRVGVPLWVVVLLLFGALPIVIFTVAVLSAKAHNAEIRADASEHLLEEVRKADRIANWRSRCERLASDATRQDLETPLGVSMHHTNFEVFVERCMEEAGKEEWR
jgi:hypothetical protein